VSYSYGPSVNVTLLRTSEPLRMTSYSRCPWRHRLNPSSEQATVRSATSLVRVCT